MATCARCPATCRTPTRDWAASTASTPPGWSNPDSREFRTSLVRGTLRESLCGSGPSPQPSPRKSGARAKWHHNPVPPALIRAVSRWCFAGVLRLKGFGRRILPIKARRVGRSTQTYLDADHGPLRAEHDGARERRLGGAVAAVAGPHRPADHRPARPAHRRCHPCGRDLCRPLRVRRQDRDLPRPLDLRPRAAVGRLGGGAARLRLAAAFARRRYRADPRQCALAGRRLAFEFGAQAPDRPPRRRAGAPRHLAVVAGPIGARRYRRQILPAVLARPRPRNPLSALHHDGHRRRAATAGPDRAVLRLAVPGQPGPPHPRRHAQTVGRIAAADPARWRAHFTQSRRADRTLDRPVAAAADLRRPQYRA